MNNEQLMNVWVMDGWMVSVDEGMTTLYLVFDRLMFLMDG